jgi:hypothetical protein
MLKICFLLIGVLIGGCASIPQSKDLAEVDFSNLPLSIVSSVPFIEQTSILCGPTSLYMAAKKLKPELELGQVTAITLSPGASGSFKQDMLAATRRLGLAPYRIHSLNEIFIYLAHGTPVVLFHETQFFTKHFWHYSVLAGYDRRREKFVMHIGDRPYYEMNLNEVIQSYEIGGKWAFVVQGPGELPMTATLEEARDNAIILLHLGMVDEAKALAVAMQTRWPEQYESDVILADAASRNKETEKARMYLKRAYRKQPGNLMLKKLLRQAKDI